MKKILLVVLIIFFFLRGYSANKYFAANGSDAGTGSITSPYKTIAKLNAIWSTLSAGDSVLFRRGDVFYGSITVTKSGTLAANIKVGSYGSSIVQPIITSLVDITGWVETPVGSHIWQSAANATLGATVKIVLSNDTLAPIGRFPNADATNGGYLTYEGSTANRLQITDNQLLNSPNWTGAQVVVRVKDYVTETRLVSSHTGTQINFASAVTDVLTNGNGFYFQASLQTLDRKGEWYFNPLTKRISMYSLTMPTNVQAAALSSLVTSTTFSNITFTNINFKGANDYGFNVGVCSACGSGGSGFQILNCKINFTTVGILTNQHINLNIKNDTIIESGSGGIYINNAHNSIVRRNYVRKTAQQPGMILDGSSTGYGIWHKGDNIITDSNQVILTGYSGIKWEGSNITVAYNFVDTVCNVKNDGGMFYHNEGSITRTNVRLLNNIGLHGIGASAGTTNPTLTQAEGIYLDILSHNTFMQGNTIAYAENGIMFNYGASNNQARANTLFNNKNNFFVNMRASQLSRNDTIRKNILFSYLGTQVTASYQTSNNDIGLLGKIDSNYHARPVLQTTIIRNQSTNQTLPMFRTSFPQYEAAGQISPVLVSNLNQILFLENHTFAPTVTTLSGTWKDVFNVSYSGSVTLQPFTSVILMSLGSLVTPVITWPSPSPITYPATLSGVLNATANVPGTFVYTRNGVVVSNLTVLNAGTYTLDVLFTSTDGVTYSTATKSVTLVVNKATATLAFGADTVKTYTGLPLAPTVITNPAGLTGVNILYDNVGQTPTNAKTYQTIAGLTNPNYSAASITGTFRIAPAPATISVSNTVYQYDSTLKQVVVTTNPLGLNYTITSAKRYSGTYAVHITLNEQNYTATAVDTTLTITKGTTTVSWSPANLTYPTPTGAGQTNATSPKTGVFTYIPPSGTVLTAGTQPLLLNFVPSDTNISPLNGVTRDIVVSKGTTTISVTDTTQYADGNPKFITAVAGQLSGTVTVTYTGAHTTVGNYPFTVSYLDSNWQAATVTGTLHILAAPASIVITNYSNRVYTGSPIVPTVTSVYSYSLVYNPTNHTDVNSNIQVIATINDGLHTGADTVTMSIIKATPSITWPAIASGVYPYVVSSGILNATSPISGSFAYSVAVGDTIAVGTTILSTVFTSSNSNYNNVTVTNSVTVTKGTDVIVVSDTTQSFDGLPKPITATSSHGGTLTILYGGSPTVPTAIGNYPFTVSYSNANWQAATVSSTLHITSNPATIFITNFSNRVYTGSPISPTVSSSYSYTLTFNGSATVPTNVNSYITIATINDGIHSGADTVIMTIIKANPPTTWGAISAITYPTPLSGTQLNLTSSIPVSVSYDPASGDVLGVGTHIITATVAPTDLANYNIITTTNTIVVNKGTTSITVSDTVQNYDGLPKSITAVAGQSGTLTILYGGSPTPPTLIGDYPFTVSFSSANWQATTVSGTLHITTIAGSIYITNFSNLVYTGSPITPTVTTAYPYTISYSPSNHTDVNNNIQVIATINDGIHIGADTVIMSIIKAFPPTTWGAIADINYPTALSGTQLNLTSTVAGSATYNPPIGTILSKGTHTLNGTWTPTDLSNYNPITVSNTITVTDGIAVIHASNFNQVYDGTAKSITASTSPANLKLIILYNGSPTLPINAGSYAVTIILDDSNYVATPVSGTLVISKINAVLTYQAPIPIPEGTSLNSIQLNASSNISGYFTYVPNFGNVPPSGTSFIVATFHPTDSVNYNITTISVPLSVYGNSIPSKTYYIRNGHIIYINKP